METAKLKKFAQFARRSLIEQVSAKLKLVLAENSAARRESAEAVKKLEEAIKGTRQGAGHRAGGLHLVQPLLRPALHGCEPLHPHRRGVARRGTVPARDPGRGQDGPHRRRDGAREDPAADLRPARRQGAQPRPAGRGLPPAAGGRLQLLAQGHAVPVRAHRRLHRTADARRPALGQLHPAPIPARR